jgi:hypothetical protein
VADEPAMSALRPQPARPPGPRGVPSLTSRLFHLAAFALTFVLVAGLVLTSSHAAFVAQNDNTQNTVTSASIDLTDNAANGAMFNSVGLVPGTNVVKCIEVAYTGNIDPLPVKLYATTAPTGTLAPYLNLTIDVADANDDAFGTCTGFGADGGSTNVYTGTLADFATAHADYATGRSTTWDPTGTGQAHVFRFTLSVQDVTAAEAKSTTFGFSWETRTS